MKPLAFYHLAKCAGTTLKEYFINLYSVEHTYGLESSIDEKIIKGHSPRIDYLDLYQIRKACYFHDPYFLEDWSKFNPQIFQLLFLRSPLERMISLWKMFRRDYNLNKRNFKSRKVAARYKKALKSFTHWMHDAETCRLTTAYYLLMLSDPTLNSLNFQKLLLQKEASSDFFKIVFDRLELFDFIGLIENFSVSLNAVNLFIGAPAFRRVQAYNQHKEVLVSEHELQEGATYFEDMLYWDNKIYEKAKRLNEIKIKSLQDTWGEDFQQAATDQYFAGLQKTKRFWQINMSDGLQGGNFHTREINGFKISRWIGPEAKSSLHVSIPKNIPLKLYFMVSNWMSDQQIEKLCIFVDGQPVQTWKTPSPVGYEFAAILWPEQMNQSSKVLTLSFDCGKTLIPENPEDPRRLGVELTDIFIEQLPHRHTGGRFLSLFSGLLGENWSSFSLSSEGLCRTLFFGENSTLYEYLDKKQDYFLSLKLRGEYEVIKSNFDVSCDGTKLNLTCTPYGKNFILKGYLSHKKLDSHKRLLRLDFFVDQHARGRHAVELLSIRLKNKI